MDAQQMRHEIFITIKANGVPVTGDLFLALAFRTEDELRKLCAELHINTKGN